MSNSQRLLGNRTPHGCVVAVGGSYLCCCFVYCEVLLAILPLCNNYTSARYRAIILIYSSYDIIVIIIIIVARASC